MAGLGHVYVMKSFQQILENYTEIGDQLRAYNDTEFKIKPRGLGIEIDLPCTSSTLRLGKNQLEILGMHFTQPSTEQLAEF